VNDEIVERNIELSKKQKNYFTDQEFDPNFLFVDTTRYYNLHFTDKSKKDAKTSYTFHPLRSLLRGLFFDEEVAQRYASFFYSRDERYYLCKSFKQFADIQLENIVSKWKDQNIIYTAWEFFYIALNIENNDLRRKVLDNLIQLLSSDYAFLYSTTRINKVLRMLITAFLLRSIAFYRVICYYEKFNL